MKNRTVVIDFPWSVKNGFTKVKFVRYGKKLPYESMTNEQCLNFPINDFADEKCDLFMWVTHTTLPLGLDIMKAWGFKYHCLISWDKRAGIGFLGFDRRNEFCIYGYRGEMGIDKSEGSYIPTVIRESRSKHSQKPDSFYEILRTRTKEPRIDIFARRRHFGFSAYGDQIEHEIQIPITQTTIDRNCLT